MVTDLIIYIIIPPQKVQQWVLKIYTTPPQKKKKFWLRPCLRSVTRMKGWEDASSWSNRWRWTALNFNNLSPLICDCSVKYCHDHSLQNDTHTGTRYRPSPRVDVDKVSIRQFKYWLYALVIKTKYLAVTWSWNYSQFQYQHQRGREQFFVGGAAPRLRAWKKDWMRHYVKLR